MAVTGIHAKALPMSLLEGRSKITPVDVNYHRQFRKSEAAMKVWGLILAGGVVFLISGDAFAWKDKSKITNDDRANERQRYNKCLADCGIRLESANAKCNFVFSDIDDAAKRGQCFNYMSGEAGRCARNCE
jgi:hypothetical protein